MRWLKSVGLVILMIVVFILTIPAVNQEVLPLKFGVWETPALSNFWWLLGAFLIGLTIGVLNGAWVNTKHRMAARKLRQSLNKAEAELERLRSVAP